MDIQDAYEIQKRVNSGGISAKEVAESALRRIEEVDGKLGAFLASDREKILARADDVDRMVKQRPLPLAGVPVAVKDNICTRGLRTTCGSRMLENYVPPYSATAVERLEAAGAVVIGKANCDEFAMGSSTENSAFRVTRNPYDPERVPGGSSGGSAVAVAAGMAPLALGSETGGSVRQPASFCNILGLKPTYGRVSRYGLVAFASSLDCIAPMANSARDLALLLSHIAGHDDRDSTSSPLEVPDYVSELTKPVRGMRLGIPREYFGEGLDPEVRSLVEAGIRNAVALGCEVQELSMPHTKYAIADYYIIAPAEASSNLARFDGVKYGYRVDDPVDLLDMYRRTRSGGFGEEVKLRIMIGTYALSSGYYEAYYGRAMKVRTLIKRDYDLAFEKVDLILGPVCPTPAFRIGEKVSDPLSMYLSDIYTVTANLAGVPSISVPCGFTREGLPVGLQVIGNHFQEGLLLRMAQAYADAHPLPAPALRI
jgi:aspartyl-tRNA(Asn)/glutamyl-tRNA(Gln) amidotransferase subunit A